MTLLVNMEVNKHLFIKCTFVNYKYPYIYKKNGLKVIVHIGYSTKLIVWERLKHIHTSKHNVELSVWTQEVTTWYTLGTIWRGDYAHFTVTYRVKLLVENM
jgi:hypothetical protein